MKKNVLLTLLLVCTVALTSACGSVGKTAYNGLTELKAAYVTANSARMDFCRPKAPKPPICVDSNKPMQAAFETIKTGSLLLEQYEATGGADAKAKLKAFIPVIVAQSIEILKLAVPPE